MMYSPPRKPRLPSLCERLDIEPSLEELFLWLAAKGLTRQATGYEVESEQAILSPDSHRVLGIPCSRSNKKKKEDLDRIQQEYGTDFSNRLSNTKGAWEKMWSELRNPGDTVRHLDIKRIPADAIAFYRPFHFPPFEQWGIYIHIARLLKYSEILESSLGTLSAFPPETLAVAVLFDVFHHEFFHHLVESTATILEVICAGVQQPRSIYLEYRAHKYEEVKGPHPHKPLEDALANAYAYNSFSFISRVKIGYKDSLPDTFLSYYEMVG